VNTPLTGADKYFQYTLITEMNLTDQTRHFLIFKPPKMYVI